MSEFNHSDAVNASQLRQQIRSVLCAFTICIAICALSLRFCCADFVSWTGIVVGYLIGASSLLFYGALVQYMIGSGAPILALIGGLTLKVGTLLYAWVTQDLSDYKFVFSALGSFLVLLPAAGLWQIVRSRGARI